MSEERKPKPVGQPLEMILARNLLTNVSTPALLVDGDTSLLFFNEAAAAVLGRAFEDVGRMSAEEWSTTFGPLDGNGQPLGVDRMSATEAIRAARPAHGEFEVRRPNGEEIPVEASTFPVVGPSGVASGAMILFWSLADEDPQPIRAGSSTIGSIEGLR